MDDHDKADAEELSDHARRLVRSVEDLAAYARAQAGRDARLDQLVRDAEQQAARVKSRLL
jgi:hypothetical protein